MWTKFPLYIGLTVFAISILISSVKLGEKGVLLSKNLIATQNQAQLKLSYTSPNIVTVNLSSTKEIAGADIVLTYDEQTLEILPSTLSGLSQFITTGGEVDQNKGIFIFSVVNIVKPAKNAILASFRVKAKAAVISSNKGKWRVEFDSQKTRIYSENLQDIAADYEGTEVKLR